MLKGGLPWNSIRRLPKPRTRPPGRFHSKALLRVFCILAAFLVLYEEILAYKSLHRVWPSFMSPKTRFLLVADPQLIGYRNEPGFVGPISRWDSDRYLKKSFEKALKHVEPDLIIFLGDLFDEGSSCTDQDFQHTLKRFRQIFMQTHSTPCLFIPGDNDVGGEDSQPVLREKVERFQEHLPHSGQLPLGFSFSTGNLFDGTTGELSGSLGTRILLSHHPLTSVDTATVNAILRKTSPQIIVSAHHHTARVYRSEGRKVERTALDESQASYSGRLGKGTLEFQVPTCSYRMGVPQMGFGVMELYKEETGELSVDFHVLWLPHRYSQLFVYLAFLGISLPIFLLFRCATF